EDVFQKNLPATLHVLAQDAKIQVDFDPSVVAQYRLLGYENRDVADKDFRNDKVDAGEVGPGSTVTVLYELRRKTNAAGGLGKVYLRYRDTGTGRVEETNHPLPPGVLATSDKDTSDRFRFVACVAELAEVLRGSYWARNGSFVKIQRVLATVSPAFRELPEWKEVADLVGRAQALAVVQLLSRDAPDSNAAAQKGSK
ncbi:MAG TPA: YfbK domain-containing protein, partial [Planctomycetota bacterium]|nr:YfbK domain-containing protein [Planctomycetota bacterium]